MKVCLLGSYVFIDEMWLFHYILPSWGTFVLVSNETKLTLSPTMLFQDVVIRPVLIHVPSSFKCRCVCL